MPHGDELPSIASPAGAAPAASLAARYVAVRRQSEALAAPLSAEDQTIQSMLDVSPTKWHLAHTSWFFETFVLQPHIAAYRIFDARFAVLFNSYYNGVGEQYPRARRGLISRPGVDEVLAYRRHVDAAMIDLLTAAPPSDLAGIIELGLNHEQQHQELMVMDIKHVLSINPALPAYGDKAETTAVPADLEWLSAPGGLYETGHVGAGFVFDNERPRHRNWAEPFDLANRLVTNGEFLQFMRDGGYSRADLWLSDGWTTVNTRSWQAPLYWIQNGDDWSVFTLAGPVPVDADKPVCHVSLYEAAAFAKWAGRRLQTEAEWEIAATLFPGEKRQWFGQVWQWTASAYAAYPGYREPAGAIGEYNGKFMANQMVLRGSCCATPAGHARTAYRNFFPADARWPYAGIRLAKDAP